MRRRLVLCLLALGFGFCCGTKSFAAQPTPQFELRDGDRVAFIGDTFAEREQYYGYIELALASHFPDRKIAFRNLGWSGDTPAGESRASLSKLQAGHEPDDQGWLELQDEIALVKPTVVFLSYGMASSFDGEKGLPKFKNDFNRLIDTIQKQAANNVRFVVLSPIRHENLGAPLPDPAQHNAQLAIYTRALKEIADQRGFPFVSLFDDLHVETRKKASHPLTENGIHLSKEGYQKAAETIEHDLGLKSSKLSRKSSEAIRERILRKNELFFARSRPQNMAYLLGFRKYEQGKNAAEIPQFDPLVDALDQTISQMITAASRHEEKKSKEFSTALANPPLPIPYTFTPQAIPEFEMAPGFEATLWAEDPQLAKPIQMNFDAQGRLWVASSEIYPQIEPGQKANDKIIILEDTNGSGKANKSSVFVDGLFLPTAVIPGDGGAYVGESTELLHFSDTDHDGKADQRRVVLSGFGTEDTHHIIHTLRWGMDGELHFNQSIYIRSHLETPRGVVRLISGGVFDLRPKSMDLEVELRGFCNPWGDIFDDYGQLFVTDGCGGEGVCHGIRSATYFTYAKTRREIKSISPGSYPKFCGLEIIRSEQFPKDWQGNLITCDFRAHRVTRFAVSEDGSGFAAQEMPELMRSTNVTFRPIDVKMGPDGALYVADWSNPIINHGEVDFRDPRRDHEHGRIWRITAKGRPLVQKPNLVNAKNSELLNNLLSPNEFTRAQSRRVLTERGAKITHDLDKWTKQQTDERAQLEALWMYESIDVVNEPLLEKVFSAKDGKVRAAAASVTGKWHTPLTASHDAQPFFQILSRAVKDPHPRVRLEAVRALARVPDTRSAELVLSALDQPTDYYLEYAIWLSINDLAEPWLTSIRNGTWKAEGHEKQLEYAVRALEPGVAAEVMDKVLANKPLPRDGSGPWIELIGTTGTPAQLRHLFDQVINNQFSKTATDHALRALNQAAKNRNVIPTGDLNGLTHFIESGTGAVRSAAIQLAGAWKLASAVDPLFASVAKTNAVQIAAFNSLQAIGGEKVFQGLQKLASRDTEPTTRRHAVITMAHIDLGRAVTNVVDVLLSSTTEEEASMFWRSLLNVAGAGPKIAAALPKSDLPAAVAKSGLKIAREGGKNESELVLAITRAANLNESEKTLTPDEMKQLAASITGKGNPAHGEKLFRSLQLSCVNCHSIGGAGGKVGPDLTSIGASAPVDYLIESVLFPNAKIKEGYHTVILQTKDDQEFSGIVVRETDSEIILRDSANKEVSVLKANVQSRKNGASLMPSGLVDNLSAEDRTDLFRFLSELGKPGPYDASKGNVARAWKIFIAAAGANQTSNDALLKGDTTVPGWEPMFSTVNGELSDTDLQTKVGPIGTTPRLLFATAHLQLAKDTDLQFNCDRSNDTEVFVDGKAIGEQANNSNVLSTHLPQGKHSIVLKLRPEHLPEKVRLQASEGTFLVE